MQWFPYNKILSIKCQSNVPQQHALCTYVHLSATAVMNVKYEIAHAEHPLTSK